MPTTTRCTLCRKDFRATAVIDKLCERHLPEQFRTTFNAALTQGKDLGGATDLGPFTRAAIARVAADHPEATCEIIAATYEVFPEANMACSRH